MSSNFTGQHFVDAFLELTKSNAMDRKCLDDSHLGGSTPIACLKLAPNIRILFSSSL